LTGETFQQFEVLRVIPVVAVERPDDALRLADTLAEGGLPCAEITFRTAAAVDAMRIMTGRGGILIGAGTVLDVDQVKAALDAGARFMVSPGFNPVVAAYCVENGIDFTPGVCTPTEIEGALGFGLKVMKFFPAEAFGGLNTLKALSGPYPEVKFIPTGGITLQNLLAYLKFPKVLACGGTWIAPAEAVLKGRFGEILKNAREAVKVVSESGRPSP